jgi:hypothetical protein
MSHAQQNDPDERDIALARALARALKQREAETAASAVTGASAPVEAEACPPAELLAAYAESALDAHETAQWESHFAMCSRCRTVLSVLAASTDEPLAESEVLRLGEVVAAATVPGVRAPKQPSPVSRFPAHWRWLAPAIGVAAAGALFFILRPPPRFPSAAPQLASNQSAENKMEGPGVLAPNPQSVAKKLEAPSQPVGEQMAQANVPPPPFPGVQTSAPDRKTLSSSRENFNARAQANARVNTGQKEKSQNGEPALPAPLPPGSAGRQADGQAGAQAGAPAGTGGSASQAEEARATASSQGVNPPPQSAVNPAPAAAPFAPAAQAKSAPAPTTAPGKPSEDAGARQAPEVRNQTGALSMSVARRDIFMSPDGKVYWRLGSGGRIERSVDSGRSWQPQASGVASNLVAGAATSEETAWVVGQAGTILRTTDGAHWQRIAPPVVSSTSPNANTPNLAGAAGGTPDWISIAASDALHATVISSDSRRFRTEDGGRTWTQQ